MPSPVSTIATTLALPSPLPTSHTQLPPHAHRHPCTHQPNHALAHYSSLISSLSPSPSSAPSLALPFTIHHPRSFKAKIEAKSAMRLNDTYMKLGGKILQDDHSVVESGITKEARKKHEWIKQNKNRQQQKKKATLHLVSRLRGAGPSNTDGQLSTSGIVVVMILIDKCCGCFCCHCHCCTTTTPSIDNHPSSFPLLLSAAAQFGEEISVKL